MPEYFIGTDIVAVSRIQKIIHEYSERFKKHTFKENESIKGLTSDLMGIASSVTEYESYFETGVNYLRKLMSYE